MLPPSAGVQCLFLPLFRYKKRCFFQTQPPYKKKQARYRIKDNYPRDGTAQSVFTEVRVVYNLVHGQIAWLPQYNIMYSHFSIAFYRLKKL